MNKTSSDDNRARLLEAAAQVAHRRGFDNAALADIAREARVPLGNVYYYFKTKDEIGGGIVDLRLARFKKLLQRLDEAATPQERLCAFVRIKIKNRRSLASLGCPVGTLCSELQKHGGAAATKSRLLFAEALAWMETQFRAMGQGAASRGLAVHLLSATQGVSALAHTFHDARLIQLEARRLQHWIRSL